jgi:hypothetical protein
MPLRNAATGLAGLNATARLLQNSIVARTSMIAGTTTIALHAF